jgi:hypothetical protein
MGQIRLRGSKEFIEITKEALNLIKEKDPMDFKVLVKNIKLIEEHRENWYSYFCFEKGIPIARINKKTYTHNLEWYACGLVHEAYHSKQYHDALLDGEDPMKACSGYSAEMYCLTKQIECMKLIGASEEDLAWAISCYDKRWWEEYKTQTYVAPVRKIKVRK